MSLNAIISYTFTSLMRSITSANKYLPVGTLHVILLMLSAGIFAQTTIPVKDADSAFVKKFSLNNDIRFFYGFQGNNLSVGAANNDITQLNRDLYRNTNDFIGGGLSYGLIDGDLSISLPGTTYLKQDRANLKHVRFAFGYSMRKFVFRAFFVENRGVVVSSSDDNYETSPNLHERKIGLQAIYIFNAEHYSYRASKYQSEYQLKPAGSMLLKMEPFYRELGTEEGTVIPQTYDLSDRFATETGLQYVKAPALLVMPGYGYNFVIRNTRFFISPIIYAGAGFAYNIYRASKGENNFTSVEYSANFSLNGGYNGLRSYLKVSVTSSAGYTELNHAYLTSANLMIELIYGFRFAELRCPLVYLRKIRWY